MEMGQVVAGFERHWRRVYGRIHRGSALFNQDRNFGVKVGEIEAGGEKAK